MIVLLETYMYMPGALCFIINTVCVCNIEYKTQTRLFKILLIILIYLFNLIMINFFAVWSQCFHTLAVIYVQHVHSKIEYRICYQYLFHAFILTVYLLSIFSHIIYIYTWKR